MIKYIFFLSFLAFVTTSCATRVVNTTPATKTIVIKKVPRNHKVVVVKGNRYYRWGGKHYRKTNKGYVLVKV